MPVLILVGVPILTLFVTLEIGPDRGLGLCSSPRPDPRLGVLKPVRGPPHPRPFSFTARLLILLSFFVAAFMILALVAQLHSI